MRGAASPSTGGLMAAGHGSIRSTEDYAILVDFFDARFSPSSSCRNASIKLRFCAMLKPLLLLLVCVSFTIIGQP